MAKKQEKPTLSNDTEWPRETIEWYEAWRGNPVTDTWDARQWEYLKDTAIVHALIYGANNYAVLPELQHRLQFMGLSFDD